MRNATSTFYEYISQGKIPGIRVRLENKFGESTWIYDDEFISNSIKFRNDTSQDGNFDVGAVIISSFNFSLNNFDGRYDQYDFAGAQLDAYVGFTYESGLSEYVRMGHYYFTSHKSIGNVINCETYDALKLMDEQPPNLSFTSSITIFEAVRQMAVARGITLAVNTWPNSNYAITEIPDDIQTERQLLQCLVQICGCYARINSDGYLQIGWYGNYADYDIPTLFSQNLQTTNINITGVRVIADRENEYLYGQGGYVLVISDNPLITADNMEEIARAIASNVIGMIFRAGSISVLANPCYEVGDVIGIIDAKGNECMLIATNVSYNKTLQMEIVCSAAAEEINDLRPSNINVHAERLKQDIYKNISNYDTAYQALANLLSSAMGLYETIEDAEGGGKIIYYHNREELEESDIIWKATAEAFAVSTDGGETWNAGVTSDGNILANVLTAIGVNADWMRTGEISDQSHTNWWNLDTGVMHINAESFIDTSNFVTKAELSVETDRIATEVVEQVGSGVFFNCVPQDNSNGTTTIKAHLYFNRADVTQTYAPYFYHWYKKTEDGKEYLNYGYEITVNNSDYGYGGEIEASFVILEDRYPVNNQGNLVFTMFGSYYSLAVSQGTITFRQGHPVAISGSQSTVDVYPIFGYDYY